MLHRLGIGWAKSGCHGFGSGGKYHYGSGSYDHDCSGSATDNRGTTNGRGPYGSTACTPHGFQSSNGYRGRAAGIWLPTSPSSGNPALLQEWQTVMADAKTYLPPVSTPSLTFHVPPQDPESSHSEHYSDNWAAHVMPTSDLNGDDITFSECEWTQPSVPGNSSYSNYQSAPDASFWNDMGLDYLIQSGADSISTSTPTYKFWVEDYAAPPAPPSITQTFWESNPPIAPGDKAFTDQGYQGDDYTAFFLENMTTYTYTSVLLYTPYVGNQTADFVNERVGSYYLPTYGSSTFSGCYATDGTTINNGTTYEVQSSNNNVYNMTSNGLSTGTPLVNTGPVNNSTGGFVFTYENPGP